MTIHNLTPETFAAEVLGHPRPVLVDFWAPWCGPCRVMNPIINAIAEDNSETLKVTKLNVDEAPELASQHHITAIPTVLLFQNGKEIERFPGLVTQEQIQSRLQKLGLTAAIAI